MRALILSDIHGNLEALNAVLAAAEPYDALWNLATWWDMGEVRMR